MIYGTVSDQGGDALAGARVTVTCQRGDDDGFFLFDFLHGLFGSRHDHGFAATTVTGADGTYRISDVPSGEECTVLVTASAGRHFVAGSVRLRTHDHRAYEVDARLARRNFFFFAPISSY